MENFTVTRTKVPPVDQNTDTSPQVILYRHSVSKANLIWGSKDLSIEERKNLGIFFNTFI